MRNKIVNSTIILLLGLKLYVKKVGVWRFAQGPFKSGYEKSITIQIAVPLKKRTDDGQYNI